MLVKIFILPVRYYKYHNNAVCVSCVYIVWNSDLQFSCRYSESAVVGDQKVMDMAAMK